MTVFQAIVMGLVEGITEFLPISSTGHLILTAKLLNIPQTDFVKTFEIVIQPAAILAVIVLYWRTLFFNRQAFKKIIAAFIPTGVIGFFLYTAIKTYLIGNETAVVWALFAGGVLLVAFELLWKKKARVERIEEIPYSHAIILGIVQAISVVPGVSRAAATIVGGLALGISRRTIVEFSFLLAVPTMLAASIFDVAKNIQIFQSANIGLLLIGCVVSFGTAIASTKIFLQLIKRHSFIPFGVYRIALALVFLVFIL